MTMPSDERQALVTIMQALVVLLDRKEGRYLNPDVYDQISDRLLESIARLS